MPKLISGNPFTGLTANTSQNTDTYYFPGLVLLNPKTGFRFTHHGTIVEPVTPQTVSFGGNGLVNQGNTIPQITIPTSLLIASTTFDYQYEMEYYSRGALSATMCTGVAAIRFTASKDGSPGINPIIAVQETLGWNMTYNLAADGTIIPQQPLMGFVSFGAAGPTVNTYGSTFESYGG